MKGLALWLFSATSATDRSVLAKTTSSIAKANRQSSALYDRESANRAVGIQLAAHVKDAEEQAEQRQRGREPERCKAGLGDHRFSVCPALCSACLIAELRRHVTLVMLGEDIVGDEGFGRPPACPSATTPLPSRNRSGRMPR